MLVLHWSDLSQRLLQIGSFRFAHHTHPIAPGGMCFGTMMPFPDKTWAKFPFLNWPRPRRVVFPCSAAEMLLFSRRWGTGAARNLGSFAKLADLAGILRKKSFSGAGGLWRTGSFPSRPIGTIGTPNAARSSLPQGPALGRCAPTGSQFPRRGRSAVEAPAE